MSRKGVSHGAHICPTKPPDSLLSLALPPLSARASLSVAVLLGKPSLPHLYFNIAPCLMKNWKFICNQSFHSPPYQFPPPAGSGQWPRLMQHLACRRAPKHDMSKIIKITAQRVPDSYPNSLFQSLLRVRDVQIQAFPHGSVERAQHPYNQPLYCT